MFVIQRSEYFFPDITGNKLKRLIRRFKQTFGRNLDVFNLFLELSRLQIMSQCDSENAFGKKFPKWFVGTLLHQIGYILQNIEKLKMKSCDPMPHSFFRAPALDFPGALDAVVNHEVRGLLLKLIDDPNSFGWMLDRHAKQAVEIAFKDHDYDSMLVASSATPSATPSAAASSATPSAAASSATPSAAASSATASSAAPSAALSTSTDEDDCVMYD